MRDFFYGIEDAITAEISGKVVAKVLIDNSPSSYIANDCIRIQFVDGSEFILEYDWIYGWDIRRTDT